MSLIVKKHVTAGVTWIGIKDAGLSLCCGCPADTVKHLKKAGVIRPAKSEGYAGEEGPNAILLSDSVIQNGQIANLAEFPILQMLYLQGMNIPGHPRYGEKPLLIGYQEQLDAQLSYVTIGNHGLSSVEQIMESGISEENAHKIFRTKLYYAGGKIMDMREMVDSSVLDRSRVEIKNGVYIKRTGVNKFLISYKNEVAKVDLNLPEDEHFLAPYQLPSVEYNPGRFSVTHTGEGNGWDPTRPCMASIIHYNGKTYLIDAGPNILYNLACAGLGLAEIEGIFLSHVHDDHFAGITELLNVERKLNFYSTKLIRSTAEKKLRALTNSDIDLLHIAFNCIDLEFNEWNNLDGLEVMPVYSPHTVETNTFSFRVNQNGDYKTYSHLSDTINLTEFKKIIKGSPDVFTEDDEELIRNSYLTRVNLKKIDIGGGAIHGHLSDYEGDESDLCVMAHTTEKMEAPQENFVNVDFGDIHKLIDEQDFDFSSSKAMKYLSQYFEGLTEEEISSLLTSEFALFKPGEIVVSDAEPKKIVLILSGIVKCVGGKKYMSTLDAGNFIGYSRKYFITDLPKKYEALSYVNAIVYQEADIDRFITRFKLKQELKLRQKLAEVIRNSTLFYNAISSYIYNRIGKHAQFIDAADWSFDERSINEYVYIIKDGKVLVDFGNGQGTTLGNHDHFGGLSLLSNLRRKQSFKIDGGLSAVAIPIKCIENVPLLIWRMIELEEIRFLMSVFKGK